ncbi:hypothetical protein PF004_g28899 [Phytophthora fragariae]|uniref:Uncharacterized protein n=1 Tax=Phytophthora fragariae TaxID=53985 RepID=A0A6G0MH38_9STRA|nr:hypothetical protein PF004_g28899 [Phytophthora fragariae]
MAPMATAGVLMVNIVFLVVGAMLMLFSSLESSGWADALTDTDFEPPFYGHGMRQVYGEP